MKILITLKLKKFKPKYMTDAQSNNKGLKAQLNTLRLKMSSK